MPFIGNTPDVNFTSFAKQDITGNGGANYTLTHAVANANEIAVYVNNVRQEPTDAYSVSGTALSMTGNVASSDNFYVIFLGKAIQTTVPPDGSVSTAKIANSAVDLTSKVTGVLPVANGGTGATSYFTGVSNLQFASFIHLLLEAGVFITAFYSLRMFLLVFHGKARFDISHPPKESKFVVTFPLILLAVPSVLLGGVIFEPLVFSDWFDGAIFVLPNHDFLLNLNLASDDFLNFAKHGFLTPTFLLLILGSSSAYIVSLASPKINYFLSSTFPRINILLKEKYFFDKFNDWFFANGTRFIGEKLFNFSDKGFIDNFLVNGVVRLVSNVAALMRLLQTGYLYHYAITMFLAIAVFLWWYVPQPIQ